MRSDKIKALVLILILIAIWTVIIMNFNGGIKFELPKITPRQATSGLEDIDADSVETQTYDFIPFVIESRQENYFVPGSKNTRNTLIITKEDNQNAADKISNYLYDLSNGNWRNNIIPTADQLSYDEIEGENYGINYIFEEGVQTEGRLTITSSMIGTFGGTPWDVYEGYNFDARSGNVISIEKLGNGVREKIIDYCLNYLNGQVYNYQDGWEDRVGEEIDKIGNWYFTKDGIHVVFQKYTLGDNSVGLIQIDVPQEEINKMLYDKYKF